MARGTKLTEREKGQIDAYHEEGYSNRQIAVKLGRSHKVVNGYMKNPEEYGTRKSSGPPKKLSDREKRAIVRRASNSSISCDKIRRELQLNVHRNTVRNVLVANPNIIRGKMRKAPALIGNDKQIRLEFGRRNMRTDWTKVSFFWCAPVGSFSTSNSF
jgi:transposase